MFHHEVNSWKLLFLHPKLLFSSVIQAKKCVFLYFVQLSSLCFSLHTRYVNTWDPLMTLVFPLCNLGWNTNCSHSLHGNAAKRKKGRWKRRGKVKNSNTDFTAARTRKDTGTQTGCKATGFPLCGDSAVAKRSVDRSEFLSTSGPGQAEPVKMKLGRSKPKFGNSRVPNLLKSLISIDFQPPFTLDTGSPKAF